MANAAAPSSIADLVLPDLTSLAKGLGVGQAAWDAGVGASTVGGPQARARVAVGLPAGMWAGAEAFANQTNGAGAWAGIGGHF
jgi:hypothetical protein